VRPEDIVETVTTVGAAYEEPFGNSSALPAYFCAKEAAKEGAQLLIAGDGGDELFAGNERYTKQYVFERYFHFPETIRNRFLEPFSDRFLDSNSALLRKPSSYVAQAKIPLPDRLQTYNFLHRVGDLNLMFTREFLADINLEEPLLLLRNRYSEPEEASILNRMLYLDWKFTLADNDIRKVSGMCNLAGIDVSYPMMDDRLLDLSCEIPSSWKISRGRLRHFFKHACRNFLPQEILNKQKHGFGLPFGVWTSTNPDLQALAYDNVTRLGSRGILNRDFITQAIKLHKDGHAGYYGELIWILMMLELWMKSHEI
jgi:asparagine synthase (glutamine-hydrolysing)